MNPARIASLLVAVAVSGSAALAQTGSPSYRVIWRSATLPPIDGVYSGSVDIPDQLRATVSQAAGGRWKLELTNLRPGPDYSIEDVYFPWVHYVLGAGGCAQSPFALGGDPNDDIVLDTFVLGRGEKLVTRCQNCFTAGEYPGAAGAFSPLMIRTDPNSAEMLAATNWDIAAGIEPRTVFTSWACNGWNLWYKTQALAAGATATYGYLAVTSDGNPPNLEPWVEVALEYQAWLREKMSAAALYPVAYPEWLEAAHGLLNLQLENCMDGWVQASVTSLWDRFKERLPWIQFWGQMSDYAQDCCAQCRDLHPRYDPGGEFDVRAFAASVTAEQKHVGYYSSPFLNSELGLRPPLDQPADCITFESMAPACSVFPMCDSNGDEVPDGESPLAWFSRWQDISATDWGANAHYYDTLGGVNWGEPLNVARLYGTALSRDSLTEWPVDVYPTAFLGGGSLFGSETYFPGGAGRTELQDIWSGATDTIRFPALGTLILNDRFFFTGGSNDGYKIWGLCADYWAERQVFLLGHKFDAIWPYERMSNCSAGNCPGVASCDTAAAKQYCDSNIGFAIVPGGTGPSDLDCVDAAMTLAMEERDAHDWWGRKPRYLHRAALSAIPAGIDLRRFDDSAGAPLVVVDNWEQLAGLRFQFQGAWVPVPVERLRILEGSDLADADGDGWGDALDNCDQAPNSTQVDTDGDSEGDACDPDDDGDTIADTGDNCPLVPNPDQLDSDGDAQGDACDTDYDNDTVADAGDNCPLVPNTNQLDSDGDAQGDACDTDDDDDTIADAGDNCPLAANTNQLNSDNDPQGNACDADDDNDGRLDASDNCPLVANANQSNSDGDAFGNSCDNCPGTPNDDQLNTDGDSSGNVCDMDDDNDGKTDSNDNCPLVANANQANSDGDSQGNACDPDDDNDGVPDASDNCVTALNVNQFDCDDDGAGDACDALCTAVYLSSPAEDGHVVSPAAIDSTAATLTVGDARIGTVQTTYRGILSFDTTDLPDAAQLQSATLTVVRRSSAGSPSQLGSLRVDVRRGWFDASAALATADFAAPATGTLSQALSIPNSNGATASRAFGTAELAWINLTGLTQIRLRFTSLNNNNAKADQVLWHAGEASAALSPKLTVTYSAP